MIKKNIRLFPLVLLLSIIGCKSSQITKIEKVDQISVFKEENKIKPPKLKKGDTIGLIAPGSYVTQEQLDESIKNFENLGYKVKYGKNILKRYGYLAGFDFERIEEIHAMFLDNEVKAIAAVRGGYGCARLLPNLDYTLIKNNPKIIIGYSDITSLLYGIYAKTGLVGFHGPVGISTFNDYSIEHFNNILTKPSTKYEMKNLEEEEDQIVVINSGVAEGELVGGNLSIVVSMIGSEYDINSKNKIIFLEEIGEEPYRIDRMLTQMRQSGKFDDCAAVVLGVFSRCEAREKDPEFPKSLTLQQVLQDRLGDLGVPVIYGLSFGHITNKYTLPFGVKAQLNTYNKSLTLLEPAVK